MVAGKAIGLAVAEQVLAWGADDLGQLPQIAARAEKRCRESSNVTVGAGKC